MQRELRKSLPNKIDSLYKVFKFEIIAKIENLTNKRSKVQKYMHSFISVVFLHDRMEHLELGDLYFVSKYLFSLTFCIPIYILS